MTFTSLLLLALAASSTAMPLNKRIAQTISASTAQWERACRAAGGGEQCNPVSVAAFTTLLAAAGPCEQQDNADKMIDLAKQLKSDPTMISLTQIFAQQPRNTPSGLSVPYCQNPPKNPELKGLFQCQFQSANPNRFVDKSTPFLALGAPGTVPLGHNAPLAPLGSCAAHPDGPIPDGSQLVDITTVPFKDGNGNGNSTDAKPTGNGTAVPTDGKPTDAGAATPTDATPNPAATPTDANPTDSGAAMPTYATPDAVTTPTDASPTDAPATPSQKSPDTCATDTSNPADAPPNPNEKPLSAPSVSSSPTAAAAAAGTPTAPPACAAKQKQKQNRRRTQSIAKRIAQPDLPAVAKSWQDLCLASGGPITSPDQPCVTLAGTDGLNALLAGADPCAQQDIADKMVDFAKLPGIKNKDALIANARAYRTHARNALDVGAGLVPSTPFCQREARNPELKGLVNAQLDGVDLGVFGGPKTPLVSFGAPGTCPFGKQADVNTCSCA